MVEEHRLAIAELRAEGYAVVVFNPGELEGMPAARLEEALIEDGNERIEFFTRRTVMTNINQETGIRYGYISAKSIHHDLVDHLMYEVGKDLSFEAEELELRALTEKDADYLEEEARIAIEERGGYTPREYEDALEKEIEAAYNALGFGDREDFVEGQLSCKLEYVQIDEPIIEFEYKGVHGRTSWLGGALNLWIFESPHTGLYEECSPCVPGAGNLDQPDPGGVLAYDVPDDWRTDHDLP